MSEKSCITINCGGCGAGVSDCGEALKYMQLEATNQVLSEKKKIYFNEKSFGNMELTSSGSVILPPGIYHSFVNFLIPDNNPISYVSMSLYDLTAQKTLGKACTRISTNFNSQLSITESDCLLKIEEETEVCFLCNFTMGGNPSVEGIHGNIVQIDKL